MSAAPVARIDTGPPVVPAGPPVLLLPSLGTTADMWQLQVRSLSPSRRVLAFDHRGHRAPPSPPGPYELADLVADVLAELDRLDVDTVDLVGVSLGGTVALGVAAAAPARVRSVVTVNAPVFADDPAFWVRRAAAVRTDGMAAATTGLLSRWYSTTVAAAPSSLVLDTVAGVAAIDPEGYAGCCGAIAGLDLRATLPSLAVPLLAVTGSADAVVPAHHADLLAQVVPAARRAEIVGAGHLAPQEQAAHFDALVQEFWATTTSRSEQP